ncbi:MAG: adenosylmethionine decarboxylase [Chitinophagales bacterium]
MTVLDLKAIGKHIILELYDCPADLLSEPAEMQRTLEAGALVMGATIVESRFHHFSPLGVSGVVIIMESHLTIHTWPEYGYAAVDIFTCGILDIEAGVELLSRELKAKRVERQMIERGKELQIQGSNTNSKLE